LIVSLSLQMKEMERILTLAAPNAIFILVFQFSGFLRGGRSCKGSSKDRNCIYV